ncbi:MAG: phage tail tape measure protein [Firmicutes bacterium]|nr:phage tail tape measure protein [Bacillota bacterium]
MDSLFKLSAIISVIDQMTAPVRKMAKSVTDLEKTMNRANAMVTFGQRMSTAGIFVEGAASKMKGAVAEILAPTMEVQDSMAILKTVTTSTMGSLEKSLGTTKQAALSWSKAHSDSVQKYLQTSYMMASAGLNDIQAIAGTETALRVAKASMADAAETGNLLAIMYNNMADKTKDAQSEMTRLGDVLTKTQQYFQFENLNQLTEGLKYAIPASLQFGTSVEELNAVIGQLNNAGLQGSMAGTAYAATMRQMTKASRALGFEVARNATGGVDFIGTLQNIRDKFGDFAGMSDDVKMAFQQAFGDEGIRVVALLTGQLGELRKGMAQVQNAAGAAAAAQAERERTASQQYEILRNNITALKIDLGNNLIPVINRATPVIRRLVDSVSGFAKAHPTLARNIVLLIGVGAAVLGILAPILTVTAAFITMGGYGLMMLAKIGKGFLWVLKGAGFAGLLGKIGAGANIAANGARRMAVSMVTMGRQALRTAMTSLPPLIASAWAFTAALLANPITWIIVGIVALGTAVVLLAKNWDMARIIVANAWNSFKTALSNILTFVASLHESFRQAGVGLIQAFVNGIKTVIATPATIIKGGLQGIRNLLPFSDAKEGPLSTLTRSGQAFVTTFQKGAQIQFPSLQDAIAGGFTAIAPLGMALAGAGAAGGTIPLNFSGASPAADQRMQTQPNQKTANGLNIYGDIHIHVERMDDADDFYQELKRFAEGQGG